MKTLKERQEIYKKAVNHFSFNSQMAAACEELAELIVEIAKHINYKRGEDVSGLIDELADSRIMIEQLEFIYGVAEQVEAGVDYKLNRLEKYMETENEE